MVGNGFSVCTVNTIILMSGLTRNSFLVASKPPIPGMFISIKMTSAWLVRHHFTASSPLSASPATFIPRTSSIIRRIPVRTSS
ncbi:Uncharacterised protein [Vibrio cholerae]|nr:Uncharacterised protein [Vibrio cholerae]